MGQKTKTRRGVQVQVEVVSNPSVYGCVGRIQTPLIPSVVSMSHGLLSLYIFWCAASSISSYSFHDFLSFYGGCREKEAFDWRHSTSLLSVLHPTALKTTPKILISHKLELNKNYNYIINL